MFCRQMKEKRRADKKRKKPRGVPEFTKAHPWVCFVYLLAVLGISMITYNPCIVAASFVMSAVCVCTFSGVRKCMQNLLLGVPALVFTLGIQPLFSRAGETALFYVNDNAVSLESYLYGAVTGILLMSVIQWCSCIWAFFGGDRLTYILGSGIPSLGLMFSMILRFIPLMQQRYLQIQEAQAGLGGKASSRGIFQKIKQFMQEISVLIAWSLESSMETSASMEARGYGKGRRSCYHNYKMHMADFFAMVYMAVLAFVIAAEIVMGNADWFYLPRLVFTGDWSVTAGITALFIMLSGVPLLYEIRGVWKWRYLNSRM